MKVLQRQLEKEVCLVANEEIVQELSLEEVMGDRFGRYSKYIIQERALPDIRDGLKPVQRRILYAMFVEGNTNEKGFRKSAKTVGNVIGNYHPHGDSSVYEAMVRLSQSWKMREPLVEMHGNNGSMDGDSAAAMRYTEARLSKIAGELLRDIEKETVELVFNFDDTTHEPTVMPARFPNLLINGATGISAGYATDIPPHNLGEVIDATIHMIAHPQATAKELMAFIKGPDFPTGGIIQGVKGIQKAYETGKGKIVVRSLTNIETIRGGKQQIVVTEIPYEVNKSTLVRRMDDLRINRKLEGIAEVRDESDRTGLRIVVELKKEANAEGILTYLLKHTELQVTYHFNMVAIDKRRPEQVGIPRILTAYLAHKRDVITKRTQFDLRKASTRAHIVEGLIKAISILDKVIKLIRGSKNKADAKQNLVATYDFTTEQAEAIVSLQLYRLTNTDITDLQAEADELHQFIKECEEILSSEKKLNQVMKKELQETRKKYATERLTVIEDHIEELTVETEVLVPEEDVIVSVTKEGYIKRSSIRSYAASNPEELGIRAGDKAIYVGKLTTLQHLVLFTDKGNVINRSVHELPDMRWKDVGFHLSQAMTLEPEEKIVAVFAFDEFPEDKEFVFVTKEGFIKRTDVAQYAPKRSYLRRTFVAMSRKTETDLVVSVLLRTKTDEEEIFLVSARGFGLRYPIEEVTPVGARASGVISMNLNEGDEVVNGILLPANPEKETQMILLTHRGAMKRMSLGEVNALSRAQRGVLVLRELKSNPHTVIWMEETAPGKEYDILTDLDRTVHVEASKLPLTERYSTGSFVLDTTKDGNPVDVQETDRFIIE